MKQKILCLIDFVTKIQENTFFNDAQNILYFKIFDLDLFEDKTFKNNFILFLIDIPNLSKNSCYLIANVSCKGYQKILQICKDLEDVAVVFCG